jgi:hypothetical protein
MIKSRYTASITDKPWWLAGGIPREACVAAYQPIGARDYAASKVNLTGNTAYNAVDGAAFPTWSPIIGWSASGYGLNQHIRTGIYPKYGYSIIYRASVSCTYSVSAIDSSPSTKRIEINPVYSANQPRFLYGTNVVQSSGVSGYGAHRLAITKVAGYVDGSQVATITDQAFADFDNADITFLARNSDGTITSGYSDRGNILAAAIYNATLTANQVAALTNAMNAL